MCNITQRRRALASVHEAAGWTVSVGGTRVRYLLACVFPACNHDCRSMRCDWNFIAPYREPRSGLAIIFCQAGMTANSPETRVLNNNLLTAAELQDRLEEIIRRMQKIQRSIQASRQPASRLELMELRDLGGEYARIIEQLSDLPDAGPG